MRILGITASSVYSEKSFFAYLATNTAYYGTCATSDGVYAVGQVGSTTTALVLVTRFNFDGTVNWQRTLDKTSQFDAGYTIVPDSSGNVYVMGRYYKDTTDTQMSFVVKYNSSGTLQYQKTIDLGTTSERIWSAAITSGGDIYASGTYGGVDTPSVVKFDTTPTISWARSWQPTISSVSSTTANDIDRRGIAVDSSGNSYTFTNGFAGIDPDQWFTCEIAKYNSSGTVQAGGRINSSNYNVCDRTIRGIASDGTDIYITGTNRQGTEGFISYYVAKLTSGITTTTWARAMGTTGNSPTAITCSSSGDVYVAVPESASSDQRILIFKYNSSGTLQWQRRIDITTPGTNNQTAYSLYVDEAKQKLIVAGRIVSNVFVAYLSTDGSGTGTYTAGSYTITYDTPSYTSSTISNFTAFSSSTVTNTNRTGTSANSNMTGATSTYTANSVSF